MTKKTPGGTEKQHESIESESSETAKMFCFFFLSLFSFKLNRSAK